MMLSRTLDRTVGWLASPPRAAGTIALMLAGLLLLGLGALVGVASTTGLQCPTASGCPSFGSLERGFLYAPNWSFTSILVWPFMYFALSGFVSQITKVFHAIDNSPMSWLPADQKQSLMGTWDRQLRWLAAFLLVALSCSLAGSWIEWWTNSGGILLAHHPWEHAELDWSIAMRGHGAWNEWTAAFFSFLAFTYQSIVIVMLLAFAAAAVLASSTIGVHAAGEAGRPLIVDLGSNDPNSRGGFERFVLAIDYMIMFVFCAYLSFFATRVQNAFLRDTDHHSDLLDFIRQDISFDPTKESVTSLFTAQEWDFSSAAVGIGSILILFFSFFFFNASLRHAAIQARNRSDHALINANIRRKLEPYDLDVEKGQARLAKINVWPLGYSDILPTLALVVICMATIIFYRLGVLLIFGWVAGWVLTRATAGLLKRS